MVFAKEMIKTKESLEEDGHTVLMPNEINKFLDEKEVRQKWDMKGDGDICFIKEHEKKIRESDAILVLNYDKNGVKNYVGGNTLMEIGFAYVLDKKIYLMSPIPDLSYKDENIHMKPIVLQNDLNKI